MSEPVPAFPVAAPLPLKIAALGVLIEAVAALVYAVLDVFHVTSGRLELGLTAAGFFMAYAIALGWCAWGLFHARRGARGPVLFSELALLGLAWNAFHAGRALLPALMVLGALVVLVGLLHPAAIAALEGENASEDPDDPADADAG